MTRQTHAQLRSLQRLAGAIVMNPLATGWNMQRTWKCRDMRAVTAEFIKPNRRLTSFERIEIYNRQYWFRLTDCMYDDFPGVSAVVGKRRFNALVFAYLTRYPSRSFTLRNLGSHFPEFVKSHRAMLGSRADLALDMARFEWAQVIAFDGSALKAIDPDLLARQNPSRLRLRLQPYIVLLEIDFPIDDFVIRLKQHNLRGEASNAIDEKDAPEKRKAKRIPFPRRKKVFVAVHRFDNSLYYKRLEPDEFRLLTLLNKGIPLNKALTKAFKSVRDPARIKDCFQTWTGLGWFVDPAK